VDAGDPRPDSAPIARINAYTAHSCGRLTRLLATSSAPTTIKGTRLASMTARRSWRSASTPPASRPTNMPAPSASVSRPTASELWVRPNTCQLAAVVAIAFPAVETNRPVNSSRKSLPSRNGVTSMAICPTRMPLRPGPAASAGSSSRRRILAPKDIGRLAAALAGRPGVRGTSRWVIMGAPTCADGGSPTMGAGRGPVWSCPGGEPCISRRSRTSPAPIKRLPT
jgi:hypothetical protein